VRPLALMSGRRSAMDQTSVIGASGANMIAVALMAIPMH
jgi:hypothetical protein